MIVNRSYIQNGRTLRNLQKRRGVSNDKSFGHRDDCDSSKQFTIIARGVGAMRTLGRILAISPIPGDTLMFYGDIGAGKTEVWFVY